MRKIPATPQEVARQIDHYEWLKKNFPTLYVSVVELVEQRTEGAQ